MNNSTPPQLSIIVPVYNVEQYVAKSLNSLLRQGLKEQDYEIVIVNDGSTDGSKDICEQYARLHSNIMLINQKNDGVAEARNHGLKVARGKWIVFVDSDDYLVDNGLKRISRVIDQYPDAELIRYYSSYSTNPHDQVDDAVDFKGRAGELLLSGGYPAFIWTYAYKKSFLDAHEIRFKHLRFSEDGLFIATVYLHNPFVVSTKADIYRYVLRADSAMGKRSRQQAQLTAEDGLSAYELIKEEFTKSVFQGDRVVEASCIASENKKKASCYSRMLGSEYNYEEYKNLKERISKDAFYPLIPWDKGRNTNLICKIVNIMFLNFFTYKASSFFFTRIFTPYILPAYRKRVWANN